MVFCDLCDGEDDPKPRKPIYSQHQAILNNITLSTINPVVIKNNNIRRSNINHTLPPYPTVDP